MKLTVIRCPECSAKVEVAPEAHEATCEYCGTRAQVQRRAGLLQRPVPLAPRSPQAAELPVALQQSGSFWWAWILLALIPLGIAAPCVGGAIVCTMEKKEEAARLAKRLTPHWEGGGVLVRDLNGDNVGDIVGYMYRNREQSGQQSLLVAIDGASHKALWPGLDLGKRKGQNRNPQGVVDDLLIRSNGGAELKAIDLKKGRIAWTTKLSEKIKRICAGDKRGMVGVFTADKVLHPLSLADGRVTTARKATEKECGPVVALDPSLDRPGRKVCKWYSGCGNMVLRDKIGGISSRISLYWPSKKLAIALGAKKPGTQVPMIAAYRWPMESQPGDAEEEAAAAKAGGKHGRRVIEIIRKQRAGKRRPKLRWKAALPSTDPLNVVTQHPEPSHLDLNDNLVVAAYRRRGEPRGSVHLTAFSVAKGKRLWDVALGADQRVDAVVLTPTHVVVSLWNALFVVDSKSGAIAHSIVFGR